MLRSRATPGIHGSGPNRTFVLARTLIGAALLGAAALAAAPIAAAGSEGDGPTARASATTVTMSGSTSIAPLVRQLARRYVRENPGRLRFRLLEGGSDVGINDVARGRVTIGNASRDPQPGDPGGLQFNRIARDGVCIVTHTGNPLADISQEQVQAIFSGQVRSWTEVPGATATGPIDLIVRTQASGTQDAFQNIFMGRQLRVASSASQKASNGLVQSSVRSNPNAIGYVDFRFTSGTHSIPYRGVACNLNNAKSGQYRGLRNFWMVTRGAPRGGASAFIRWIRTDSNARSIVSSNWVTAR